MIAEVNGEIPIVIRNDEVDWEELTKIDFDNVVISPGPGRPEKIEDFGICRQVLQNIAEALIQTLVITVNGEFNSEQSQIADLNNFLSREQDFFPPTVILVRERNNTVILVRKRNN